MTASKAPKTKWRSGTKVLVALGILFVLGLGLLLAAFVLGKPALRELIVDKARERGIELTFDEFAVGPGFVELDGCTFSLLGVTSLSARAERITVDLDGSKPKKVALSTVEAKLAGTIDGVLGEFEEWQRRFPASGELPTTAKGVSLTWSAAQDGAPWLDVGGAEVRSAKDDVSLGAEDVTLHGMPLGPLAAELKPKLATAALGLGEKDLARAPVRIEIDRTAASPIAAATLRETDIQHLARILGVAVPLRDVEVSGRLHARWDPTLSFAGPFTGGVELALKGFVPPHPPELEGFQFGNTTTFASEYALNAERTRVDFSNVAVAAGRLSLKGAGVLKRETDHARIQFDLRGNIACTALADAAAGTHLGKIMSQKTLEMLSKLTREFLQGGVGVVVRVDADTRKLEEARIERVIGVGCGLKPLKPTVLQDLGLLSGVELPSLPPGLPPLPSSLPSLPSSLPPLPALPSSLPPLPSAFPRLPRRTPPSTPPPSAPRPDAGTN